MGNTRYLVVLTNAITDVDGDATVMGSQFKYLIGDDDLLSAALAPVREAVQDWYQLGDTELGFYYMNIHSRVPYINGAVTNYDTSGDQVNADASYDSRYPLYQIAYPEDIKIAGISFATSTEGGASISGEVSYKPDMPLQWNAFELILAGNGAPYSR